MRRVDGNIENMIVRRLDGELAEQDELTLDRELIRNPAARDMLESYERIDRLAGAALSDAIGTGETHIDAHALPHPAAAHRATSHRWLWQLATGAIAAGILAVFVARFASDRAPSEPAIAEGVRPAPVPQVIRPAPNLPGQENVMHNAGASGPKMWRDTGHEMFGVLGDDGNLYWIGIDRTRTAKLNRSERM